MRGGFGSHSRARLRKINPPAVGVHRLPSCAAASRASPEPKGDDVSENDKGALNLELPKKGRADTARIAVQ